MALSDTTAKSLQECTRCGDTSSVLVEGYCSVHCFDCAFAEAIRAAWVDGIPSQSDRMNGLDERIEALERQSLDDHARILKVAGNACMFKDEEPEPAKRPQVATGCRFMGHELYLQGLSSDPIPDAVVRCFQGRFREWVTKLGGMFGVNSDE